MTAVRPIAMPRPLKLTLDDFALLHEAGAFEGHSKVELIEGVLYTMNPQRTRHAYAKTQLAFRLHASLQALGADLFPLVEGTIAMPPRSAPEPDIAIGRIGPGGMGYVPLSSIALVVEVSDTSLRYDLGKKKKLYASQGIPEYWVFEIPAGTVHQFWSPSPEGFRESRSGGFGERIESATIAGLGVETDGLI